MSSDLEKLLRNAHGALPEPAETATQRVRRRSLATIRRKRTRGRVIALLAATLVTAVALGVTAGSLNAPGVTAAREPAVLGFVPEPGWFALQSPPPAIPGQQTAAVAANVPFAADDVENGLVEPSGLPYATLLSLPADGIVLVATMTPQSVSHVPPVRIGLPYTDVELPLRLRDAMAALHWSAQVRPDQPLAQYHLGGALHGHNVDVVVYFGTPQPPAKLMRLAQRQLNGFVFRPGEASVREETAAVAASSATIAVVDRTYTCDTVLLGGVYEVEARAHAGLRSGQRWSKLPYAVAASGGWAGTLLGSPFARENSLAWITAGSPTASTTADNEGEMFPIQTGGTIGVNSKLCRPSRAAVPLRRTGLRGGAVGVRGKAFDCPSPRRVLVRVRATTLAPASFNRRGHVFLATNAVARRGELAVRTPAGKLLAYAAVDGSGTSRLFTAKGCGQE